MVKALFKKIFFFYRQTEIKLDEATSEVLKVLHLEKSFVRS